MIFYGVGAAGYATRADLGSPQLTTIAHLLWAIYYGAVALPALIVLLLSFPTGQIYPRWVARWVTPYFLLWIIGDILSVMSLRPGGATSNSVISLPVNPFFVPALAPYNALISQTLSGLSLLFLLGIVGVVVSLILRYRVAHTRERQQIKWFVWVTVVVTVVGVLLFIFVAVAPNDVIAAVYGSPLGITVILLFYSLVNTFPAIGIGLAILRHQLWEIDIIINRTLVYGTLTALLALLYVGLVIGLQALVRLFTGQLSQSPVIIVASTLAIAALFQPLRQEVDLDQLREHLLNVVQETMQPAHVSLWLRKPSRTENQKRQADNPPL